MYTRIKAWATNSSNVNQTAFSSFPDQPLSDAAFRRTIRAADDAEHVRRLLEDCRIIGLPLSHQQAAKDSEEQQRQRYD